MWLKLSLIASASALGGLARYGLAGLVQRFSNGSFPVGTLAVNTSGCLCIGLLAGVFAGPTLIREEVRLALLIGFLGGFTTFSSFGLETFSLINDGQFGAAIRNILASNIFGIAAVWFGYRLAERWTGA